jgi:hypothetical protein
MATITQDRPRVEEWGPALAPTYVRLGYGFQPQVTRIEVVLGRSLGLSFFLWEEHAQRWWSCYYDQGAGDMHFDEPASSAWKEECFAFWYGYVPNPLPAHCPCDRCRAKADPLGWLDALSSATDWSRWQWQAYDAIPVLY